MIEAPEEDFLDAPLVTQEASYSKTQENLITSPIQSSSIIEQAAFEDCFVRPEQFQSTKRTKAIKKPKPSSVVTSEVYLAQLESNKREKEEIEKRKQEKREQRLRKKAEKEAKQLKFRKKRRKIPRKITNFIIHTHIFLFIIHYKTFKKICFALNFSIE